LQLEELLKDKWHVEFTGDILGVESFSRYSINGQVKPLLFIDLEKIFNSQQKVYIYLPQQSSLPKGILGTFEEIYYY
jgi:hypothetical protein